MIDEIKVIANYLPQYHVIPENNKWWGNGFTDWVAVKNATQLFEGHNQPKIPMNEHYYNLDDLNEIKWQSELAKRYGIYGFGIYHYWFNSEMNLLGTPVKLIYDNPDIDIKYMFIWDNCSWKRTWSNVRNSNDWAPDYDKKDDYKFHNQNEKNGILAELDYGNQIDWERHFSYLLQFFKDDRYIKIDNKPIFGFFNPQNDFNTVKNMTHYWDLLAKKNGFDGIFCMSRENYENRNLEFKFRYTPPLLPINKFSFITYKIKNLYAKLSKTIRFYDYDKCWIKVINDAKKSDQRTFLSGFTGFDDTPRRGLKGRIIKGASASKFEKYIGTLMRISKEQNKEYIFITAWNEWGEGAYLEPDSIFKLEYLEALGRAIESINDIGI